MVVDLIKHTSTKEQEKIREVMVKIDFKNGDINHFLEHLARGYIEKNYKVS